MTQKWKIDHQGASGNATKEKNGGFQGVDTRPLKVFYVSLSPSNTPTQCNAKSPFI